MWPVTGMFPLLRVAYSSSYSSSSSSATSILARRRGAAIVYRPLQRYLSLSAQWAAEKEKILEQYQTATIKRISLPDGQVCEYQSGVTTPNTLLKNWNPKLSKQTVGAVFKGRLWDLNRPLITMDSYTNTSQYDQQNDEIIFLSEQNSQVAPFYTATSAFVFGKALALEYNDDVMDGHSDLNDTPPKFTYEYILLPSQLGTSIKGKLRQMIASTNHDIQNKHILQLLNQIDIQHASEHDLARLTKRINTIVESNHTVEQLSVPLDIAAKLLDNDPLKTYRMRSLYKPHDMVPLYRIGDYIDVVKGPLLPRTGLLRHFDLTAVSGTHWRAEQNKSEAKQHVTRVRGVSFPSEKAQKQWRQQQEEAQRRDHRVIGTKQQLFHFDVSSPGGPFFLPHGTRIIERLLAFLRAEYRRFGYEEVMTPMVFKKSLWEQSGHWQNYAEDMFAVRGGLPEANTTDVAPTTSNTDWYGLKPMNCPAHCLIYACQPRTAHELPMRLADFGSLHRWEAAGALSGLTRVRNFHQDDAHIFCRSDQVGEEIRSTLAMVERIYSALQFTEYELFLSTRPERSYIGALEDWEAAETALADALNATGRAWQLNPGDGAFYGPKIDICVRDALGRQHQTATIQLDFQLPQRFSLKYTDANGQHKQPVIIHRAILGSLERMLAILAEHYAGDWPLWQSPRQVMLCPVATPFVPYARKVREQLVALHEQYGLPLHIDVNTSGHSLSKMIRQAQEQRYNYLLVLGEQEVNQQLVAVRRRGERQSTSMSINDFGMRLLKSIQTRE